MQNSVHCKMVVIISKGNHSKVAYRKSPKLTQKLTQYGVWIARRAIAWSPLSDALYATPHILVFSTGTTLGNNACFSIPYFLFHNHYSPIHRYSLFPIPHFIDIPSPYSTIPYSLFHNSLFPIPYSILRIPQFPISYSTPPYSIVAISFSTLRLLFSALCLFVFIKVTWY